MRLSQKHIVYDISLFVIKLALNLFFSSSPGYLSQFSAALEDGVQNDMLLSGLIGL